MNCISHYKLKTIYFKRQRWCIQEIVNPRNLLYVIQIHWTCIHPQHYDITKKFSKVYLRKNSNLEMRVCTQKNLLREVIKILWGGCKNPIYYWSIWNSIPWWPLRSNNRLTKSIIEVFPTTKKSPICDLFAMISPTAQFIRLRWYHNRCSVFLEFY